MAAITSRIALDNLLNKGPSTQALNELKRLISIVVEVGEESFRPVQIAELEQNFGGYWATVQQVLAELGFCHPCNPQALKMAQASTKKNETPPKLKDVQKDEHLLSVYNFDMEEALNVLTATNEFEERSLAEYQHLLQNCELHEKNICKFPLHTNHIKKFPPNKVVAHARKSRPIVHEKFVELIESFHAFKCEHGSEVEKKLYQNMENPLVDIIDRLLNKRPVCFVGGNDSRTLRGGARPHGDFKTIGTDHECAPLVLRDYMSYDEILLAALIGVSSWNHFINRGDRTNRGQPTHPGNHIEEGVYIGQVGARFERRGVMERLIMQCDMDKTEANGYGRPQPGTIQQFWADFYGVDHLLSLEQALDFHRTKNNRVFTKYGNTIIDREIYYKRMKLSSELLLWDAERRGEEEQRPVYVHAVGLGAGVWALHPQQQNSMIAQGIKEAIEAREFKWVQVVDFSWMDGSDTYSDDPTSPQHNQLIFPAGVCHDSEENTIAIKHSRRNPFDKIPEKYLIVAQYAWDGNSFPGNEYFWGSLTASGDPAAASCSNISQLQNPYVNDQYINAANTLVLFADREREPVRLGTYLR